MKNPIADLNKIFDSRIRLGVMSLLAVNENVSFNELKEMLALTDGNLASHLNTLEQAQYLNVNKAFVGRKTSTTYSITALGKQSFKMHLDALEKMIRTI
ncbi:winged helix-turn-helix domain-containing protein [Pedobacter insulae]|uniref:Winged helix DNA-binding domain-containing protein n=1 Tax=Pedobacter insulae TaxID=414048 RepID=A0A1I2VMM0_9SPHI|nr:transcriptional regulator [Pedobacter insulae]SFG88756.1 Winged helix DNA-binding domain-containing protein [Pedobacter insulae]